MSSLEQNPARQLEGIPLEQTFIDRLSGKDVDRPQLSEMLRFVLMASSTSGGSSATSLVGGGVRAEFVKEQLTFTGEDNSMAQLLLSVMGAFAEFERSLIRERQREGVALAKAWGAYRGRKRSLTDERVAELRERAGAGGEGRPGAGVRHQPGDGVPVPAGRDRPHYRLIRMPRAVMPRGFPWTARVCRTRNRFVPGRHTWWWVTWRARRRRCGWRCRWNRSCRPVPVPGRWW